MPGHEILGDLLGAAAPLDPGGKFGVPVGDPTRQPESQRCRLDLGAIPVMALTTALPTFSGEVVPSPGGDFTPESWNMPASTDEARQDRGDADPLRLEILSQRQGKPRIPNLVAQ